MNGIAHRLLASATMSMVAAATMIPGTKAEAQCPAAVLASGLREPLGITQSNKNNLIVGETGTTAPNTGRISIVDSDGNRRTLLDGLPSGINDVLEPSGPAGVFMRGRTLYVAIGVGDVAIAGPIPGTSLPNPNPPSSPIFSSVLAIHFSAHVERITEGFTLSIGDHEALADGGEVKLSNGAGDKATVELVADFPDFIPNPIGPVPGNVRLSNPFDLVVVGSDLYVTDGGRNLVWKVDIHSGAFSQLAAFPPIPNPLPIGPPVVEAVPTGIRYSDGLLLVALFRGAPFPPGESDIEQVDPVTGSHSSFIGGLKTAVDVIPIREGGDTDWLVLQHASAGPFFGSPGSLLRFETPDDVPTVVVDCLSRPSSMTIDEKTGTLFITEPFEGRIVTVPVAP
ncbi:MAG TPA: ScyD/ScyE family protein [Thermoanaerobaculia bacterium]|nr:ScyD/ScyE family protein [Thermoanaerobaculia bacterium]